MRKTTEIMQEYSKLCTDLGNFKMNVYLAEKDIADFEKKMETIQTKLHSLNREFVNAAKAERAELPLMPQETTKIEMAKKPEGEPPAKDGQD